MKTIGKVAFAFSTLALLPLAAAAMEPGTWMEGSNLADASEKAQQRLQWICSGSGKNLVPGSTRIGKVEYGADTMGDSWVFVYMTGKCE